MLLNSMKNFKEPATLKPKIYYQIFFKKICKRKYLPKNLRVDASDICFDGTSMAGY